MALIDWLGKWLQVSVYQLLNIPFKKEITTAYTIPISNKENFLQHLEDAHNYTFLKIKMGSEHDEAMMPFLKTITVPFAVDANQGWKNDDEALKKINALHKSGALFIEQPLPVNMIQEQALLKQYSPLPIYADEALQTVEDFETISQLYDGINIKLVKCGGLINAITLVNLAKEKDLKTLTGCMSESGCAVTAAAHIAALTDYADLDGPLLISNNPFEDFTIQQGSIVFEEQEGLGVKLKNDVESWVLDI